MVLKKISWISSYDVNFFDIDLQHKLFFRIIERIIEEYNNGNKIQCVNLISELIRYTEFHFSSEENFMIKYHYPEIEIHKREHKHLLNNLREKIISLDYDYINFEEIIPFLFEWFKGHTITEDKKLASFLNNQKDVN